ncbi:RuvB-like protein 1 [Hamiltosporidium tvaerminnensis]|nr:RuvB-like protein 1 [Hamiltosporidium tvaerminnensis]
MSTEDLKRISTHSHIKSLGLNSVGEPIDIECGVVGQYNAREACGIVVELVKNKKMAGRSVLFVGPMGSGKTALALALSKDIGSKTPFYTISGSEVFSTEVKKTEILQEALRKSILIRFKEIKEIYEGEVVDLNVIEFEDLIKFYKKTIKEIIITLKTNKGSKKIKLSPSLYETIEKQRISLGDIVYIESNSGIIKRLGKCETHKRNYDIEAECFIPLPKGEVLRRKEIIQEVTLHDLDISTSKPNGNDVVSILSQIFNPKKSEITEKLRNEVNLNVNRYLECGNADVIPGVLFIDEAHMMDLECFTFLHKAIESPFSPLIVFSSNKLKSKIRGSKNIENHFGMPKELLDRLVIIPLQKNTTEINKKILQIRINEECINVSSEALTFLSDIAESKGLRYVLCILPVLKVFKTKIERNHVEEVTSLFIGLK